MKKVGGMLKTITPNQRFLKAYKRVISLSSKNMNYYSTALFLFRRTLKVGFTDTKAHFTKVKTYGYKCLAEFT